MGWGVATSLLRSGFPVTAYDIRADQLARFREQGGQTAASPAETGSRSSVLIILVLNAEQTEQALFGENGAAAALAPGSVVISSSTVAPGFAADLGHRLQQAGLLHIDAPISGGAAKAAQGQLSIMASGSPAAFDKCERVFAAIASKIYRIGENSGQGSTVKMINQLLAGVHIAAAAEAMALGIKAGADPETLFEVISGSAGSSWMFQNRVPHILAGDYTPLSAVNIFVKDLGIVLDSARKHTFPLPLTAAAHQMFLTAAAAGHGFEDDSAVVKIFSGVDLPKKKDVA